MDDEKKEGFRESLKDVKVIIEKLAPHCESLDDLIGMIDLAQRNDGQLKLLYTLVTAKVK